MKPLTAFLLFCTAAAAAADTIHRLNGIVRNTTGQPIAGLKIHFYHKNGAGFDHLTATTATNGLWSIDLPPGEWRGAAHTDDILSRGYFCEPGFVWCPEGCSPVIGDWPDFWGEGEIIWTPIDEPGLINVTIVPTRPALTVEKPRTVLAGVKVAFETTRQDMTLVRQWRIEKSTDLLTWSPLQTVALSGSSPVIVPDPASVVTPVCYYRAVQVEDFIPSGP